MSSAAVASGMVRVDRAAFVEDLSTHLSVALVEVLGEERVEHACSDIEDAVRGAVERALARGGVEDV